MNDNVEDDGMVGGYYTSIADMRRTYAEGKSNLSKINIFAAILSYTMPKATSNPKASHKFSVTFALIDPSQETHSESIFFTWFCNSTQNLHMQFRVGDIIRIENADMQVYNGQVQVFAKDHSAQVSIFHRKEVLCSGRPMYPIDSPATFAGEVEAQQAAAANESQVAAAQARRPFTDQAWSTTMLGVENPGVKYPKKVRDEMPPLDPNRAPKMWVDEVAKLIELHIWATNRFANYSYSDPTYHSTLHALQSYLHRTANSRDYANLAPTVEALPQDASLYWANQNRLATGKCDVVCLVMAVHTPQASTDGLARMTIWDGSTNGVYSPNAFFSAEIYRSMQAPALHDAYHASRAAASAVASVVPAAPAAPAATSGASSSAATTTTAQEPATTATIFPLGVKLTELENATHTIPPRYNGCAVKIQACDISTNQHILHCKVGMWVRIRNLYGTTHPVFGAALRGDSHVCPLSPAFLDVRMIMRCYTERLARRFMHEMPPPQLLPRAPLNTAGAAGNGTGAAVPLAASAGAAASSSASAATSMAVPAAVPAPSRPRRQQVFSGEPVTSLALVKAGPAPAKFCVHGKIESWFPTNIQDFVTAENRAGGMVATHMQFALTVSDFTESAQILFDDATAERFLGTSCAELLTNATKRAEILHKLSACRDQGVTSEYKIKVFVHKESVNVPVPAAAAGSNKRAKGTKGPAAARREKENQQENSYVRKTKRFIAFDTDCGVHED